MEKVNTFGAMFRFASNPHLGTPPWCGPACDVFKSSEPGAIVNTCTCSAPHREAPPGAWRKNTETLLSKIQTYTSTQKDTKFKVIQNHCNREWNKYDEGRHETRIGTRKFTFEGNFGSNFISILNYRIETRISKIFIKMKSFTWISFILLKKI